MKVLILFALLGTTLALPAKREVAPYFDDQVSEIQESEENNEDENLLQTILDFLNEISQVDSESKEDEVDPDAAGFIFGIFWDAGVKKPTAVIEDLPPRVVNALLVENRRR